LMRVVGRSFPGWLCSICPSPNGERRGFHRNLRHISQYSQYPRSFQGVAGRVHGVVRGGDVHILFFSVPPQLFPREWARGNGLKGAILNGVSGQGSEVCALWG
jgi:hypothetical protein